MFLVLSFKFRVVAAALCISSLPKLETSFMTWIKICGITNTEDALTAVEAGADALGFVFHEKSPRKVSPETAAALISQMPSSVEKVGVFFNHSEGSIREVVDKTGLTAIQLHGDVEDPQVADLVMTSHPTLKVLAAIRMFDPKPESCALKWASESVYAFLADSGAGSGRTFDWSATKDGIEKMGRLSRVAIAGGLNSHNVTEAIAILHPWGVDVSSGVEAKPGKKDPEKIRAFVAAVRSADRVQ